MHLINCCALLAVLVTAGQGAAAQGAVQSPMGNLRNPLQAQSVFAQVQGTLPDLQVSNVSGPPGRPIPLSIKVDSRDDKNVGVLFLLTGIPKEMTLNLGGALGNSWAVNSKVIDKLTLTAPDNFSGSFTITITQSGAVRSESFLISIQNPQRTQTVAPLSDPPDSTSGKGIANEPMFMKRAAELFNKGDVSQARGIFEFLAGQGSSAAAFAMGETYDPLVLSRLLIKGLEANAEKAQRWYEKAEALGNADARSRLNGLATR